MSKNVGTVLFYYVREKTGKDKQTKFGHPFGCIAIQEREDGFINRGISVCSRHDVFSKEKARSLALERLNNPASEISFTRKIWRDSGFLFFKGNYFGVEPNEFEKRMLKK